MENYRKSAHCTYDIKYHIVWITKYRKPVLMGKIAIRARELIRKICQTNDVEILAGHVGKDYIPSAGVRAAPSISQQTGTIYEGEYIPKTTDGI